MVSWRNYFTITTVMLVVFILFFFLGGARVFMSDHNTNEYSSEPGALPARESLWEPSAANSRSAIFVGGEDSPYLNTVRVWCDFSKTNLETVGSAAGAAERASAQDAPVLMISPEAVKTDGDVGLLSEIADSSAVMIFLAVPEYELISGNGTLRKLLGISEVCGSSQKLAGIRLLGGFMLGGGAEYIEDEDDPGRQDLRLEAPWYRLGKGTKCYAAGLPEEDDIENELLPPMIWRTNNGSSSVFAVCGDYLKNAACMGILSAMIYESRQYQIYPVVNAQLLTVLNAPDISRESSERVEEIYFKSMEQVIRDTVYSSLSALYEKSRYPINSFMIMQAFEEKLPPDKETLIYYLTFLRQHRAEMGISLASPDGAGAVKTAADFDGFLSESGIGYQIRAFYADKSDLDEAAAAAGNGDGTVLGGANTLLTERDYNDAPFGFTGNGATIQRATGNAFNYTFYDDLALKSYETAVGYCQLAADMRRVIYPADEDERWWELDRRIAVVLTFYCKPFEVFDKVTVSESDRRIRNFLALDYSESRNNDTIYLSLKNAGGTSWFVLRTHGEKVAGTSGCTSVKIEEDAYLITATEEKASIRLASDDTLYYK